METVNLTSRWWLPVARSLVTKALVALGTYLVAQGVLTQDTVDSAVAPLAQEIVGVLFVLGSTAYAAYQAKHKNDKALIAAQARPGDGTVTIDGQPVSHSAPVQP